jgi:2-C-methyl-D-erythritol 4-phosphate cytidylyltransferase
VSVAATAVLAMAGRDGLPFASLHRAPLYLHALRSLAASGVERLLVAVDDGDHARVVREVAHAGVTAEVRAGAGWWAELRASGTTAGLLVHDALCPLASAEFLREVRTDAAATPEVSALAFRPVTDTVKTVVDARIGGTIDREGLAALVSPAVIAPSVVSAAIAGDEQPPIDDFAQLAAWLRERGEVGLVRAPSLARRVDDASSVNLLECVDELSRRVRREPVSDAAGPGTP